MARRFEKYTALAPSSVDEYLHAKKGYKAYQTFRHIALRHLISAGPGLLNTLLHYAAKESTKLLLCERDGLGRMCVCEDI